MQPAHVKACFLGSSLTIPITDGKLSLGTWQGVWLCEHRDQAGSRKLVITLTGCPREQARSPLSPVSPIASTRLILQKNLAKATAQQRAAAVIAAGRGGLGGRIGQQDALAPPSIPGFVETKTGRLLLRQQLHLNLNLNVQETLRDGVDIDDVDEDVDEDEDENLETVTTVPLNNEQLNAKVTTTTTSSSSAASSALAKFNRIIDSTLERPADYATSLPKLSSATLQQRFNLAYPELVTQQQQQLQQNQQQYSLEQQMATATVEQQQLDPGNPQDDEDDVDEEDDHPHHDEDNQTKRNDVHYLLKQLNSFSDIEEIEIVDMKQRGQRPPMASSSLATMMPPPSPAPLASPSTQSHRLGPRFASLGASIGEDSSQLLPHQQHQFDDYLFESCHYLETNYFAATYRTAMVESSSHEFRPSTNSSSNSFELHEMQPPSVICKAGAPPSPLVTSHPGHTGHPPPRYQFEYQAETRLTTSGVQTELTVESLAKMSNCSASSSSSQSTRAPPFFRCCYTPIDRWRERRQQQKSSPAAQPPKDV
ncbi:hypothetical protein M5D96_004946 [Drosophila gunungcola]|uniref:Uncharacterized protein n=1 Tax=Drosophila gunungcola TaxID=103775 RepID=A0A9P9YVN4_9MUSC|nr:hypothetical protein M5D96_004946 [Drosophila gunungcola]